jgi:hypothetical protein
MIITAYGFIDDSGFGGRDRLTPWDRSQGEISRALRWRLTSAPPHERFGRMDLLSKYVSVAVEMLGLPRPPAGGLNLSTAVVLGTAWGCQGVDGDFYRGIVKGDGPSPTLFAYTLPTIAVGEICIRHSLGGPSYCFQAGAESGLAALFEGLRLLQEGDCERCLCIMADAWSGDIAARDWEGLSGVGPQGNFAYAFLVEQDQQPPAEQALAVLTLQPAPAAAAKAEVRDSRQAGAQLLQMLQTADPARRQTLEIPAPGAYGLAEVLMVSA